MPHDPSRRDVINSTEKERACVIMALDICLELNFIEGTIRSIEGMARSVGVSPTDREWHGIDSPAISVLAPQLDDMADRVGKNLSCGAIDSELVAKRLRLAAASAEKADTSKVRGILKDIVKDMREPGYWTADYTPVKR